MKGYRRPPPDRYAEIAFAKLVNQFPGIGYAVTRLSGTDGGLWLVSIGGGSPHVAKTIEEAVRAAIEAHRS